MNRNCRPVETGGAGAAGPPSPLPYQHPAPTPSPPRFLLTSIFDELKKLVLKWKIAQSYKSKWNSSKLINIYNIIIDIRDGILSVTNSERFSYFWPFTHYSNTQDTTHAI